MKNTVSFSSYIEDKKWFTQIDLVLELIKITNEAGTVFESSIEDFKAMEKVKANNTDKVYEDILRMTEELIEILTKK